MIALTRWWYACEGPCFPQWSRWRNAQWYPHALRSVFGRRWYARTTYAALPL